MNWAQVSGEWFLRGLKACLSRNHGNRMFEVTILTLEEVKLLERKETTLNKVKQDVHSVCLTRQEGIPT